MRTFDEIVNEMMTIEMDETRHVNEKGDRETEMDFYLEGVNRDDYEQLLTDTLPVEELEQHGLTAIWNAVKEEIKDQVASSNGLSEARKQFNAFQGRAAIYIDTDDMTAWCDVQEAAGYNSEGILTLVAKDGMQGRDDKYNLGALEKVAQAKHSDFEGGDYEKGQIDDNYLYSKLLWEN